MDLRYFRPVLPSVALKHRFPMRISSLHFSLLSENVLTAMAEAQISDPVIYEQYPQPKPGGVLDRRLGMSDKSGHCETCCRDLIHCIGHFGYIKLALPLYHPALIAEVRNVLSMICKSCSRVKLTPNERLGFRALTVASNQKLLKAAQEAAKKRFLCPFCAFKNGPVTKISGFKILHDLPETSREDCSYAEHCNPEIKEYSQKLCRVAIDPIMGQRLLSQIPTEDYCYLGLGDLAKYNAPVTPPAEGFLGNSNGGGGNGNGGNSSGDASSSSNPAHGPPQHAPNTHDPGGPASRVFLTTPADYVLTTLAVPPNCIRPSVAASGGEGTTEDDLTSQLSRILTINNEIHAALENGISYPAKLHAKWDQLFVDVALFIIGSEPAGYNNPASNSFNKKTIQGIIERISGKTGRFRANLSGKRVDFSGRSVISPDPNLQIDQIGVPLAVAKNFTYPEIVTKHNIDFLRDLVRRGGTRYPGANEVLLLNDCIRFNPIFKRAGISLNLSARGAAAARTRRIMDLIVSCVDVYNLNNVCLDSDELNVILTNILASAGLPLQNTVTEGVLPLRDGGGDKGEGSGSNVGGGDGTGDGTGTGAGSGSGDSSNDNGNGNENENENGDESDDESDDARGGTNPLGALGAPGRAEGAAAAARFQRTITYSSVMQHSLAAHKGSFDLRKTSLLHLPAAQRDAIARRLLPHDIVFRHLLNNDVVLFNRQPSLHRMSIMQFYTKIKTSNTFSFNPLICSPFNADFDGDEMNVHVLQTVESKAECVELLNVKRNICSPKNGEGLIGLTQDILTGSFILTGKDRLFTKAEFDQLVCYGYDAFATDALYRGVDDFYKYSNGLGYGESTLGLHSGGGAQRMTLEQPAILFPRARYTGKQAVSVLLRGGPYDKCRINLELGDKTYRPAPDAATGEDAGARFLSVRDDYLCIRDSMLLTGRLTKSFLAGSRSSIFYFVVQNFTADDAAVRMLRFARLTTRFLMNHGFTIGLDDVKPSATVTREKWRIVREGYEGAQAKIREYEGGSLTPAPGCTAEQTLESNLNQILSGVREQCAQAALLNLHFSNKALMMSLCGSKGSPVNIAQMIINIGQQSFEGRRAPDDMETRPSAYHLHYAKDPDTKGFCVNSFYSGLGLFEFFAHARAGRDGIVDSSCKTAETGYLQRRLMKCLEDLCVGYDGTVRNSSKVVVEWLFGGDGLDPMRIESTDSRLSINFGDIVYNTMCTGRALAGRQGDGSAPRASADELVRKVEECLDTRFFGVAASPLERMQVGVFTERLRVRLEALGGFLDTLPPTLQAAFAHKLPFSLTPADIHECMRRIRLKFMLLKLDPGTTVGGITAQSLGEPSTQMTLRSFHHAGLASMNVTQGVPRIKEIINAISAIATPIITAEIATGGECLEVARLLKTRLERTTLGQVSEAISEVYDTDSCYIRIELNNVLLKEAEMGLTASTIIRQCIHHILPRHTFTKLTEGNFVEYAPGSFEDTQNTVIHCYPPCTDRNRLLFSLQSLKLLLTDVPVCGFEHCSRAVINQNRDRASGREYYNLLVEGTDFMGVLSAPDIDFVRTVSNDVLTVMRVLGIEAARQTIINEIKACMDSHGMVIDIRHMNLVADVMCFKGRVLGITRFGLTHMKADSVLMLSSFEKTPEHLFNAAIGNKVDSVAGVSESLILGKPMELGTGSFSILRAPKMDLQTGKFYKYKDRPRTRFICDNLACSSKDIDFNAFWYDRETMPSAKEIFRKKAFKKSRPLGHGRKGTSARLDGKPEGPRWQKGGSE